jgi:hypothetical protein
LSDLGAFFRLPEGAVFFFSREGRRVVVVLGIKGIKKGIEQL